MIVCLDCRAELRALSLCTSCGGDRVVDRDELIFALESEHVLPRELTQGIEELLRK